MSQATTHPSEKHQVGTVDRPFSAQPWSDTLACIYGPLLPLSYWTICPVLHLNLICFRKLPNSGASSAVSSRPDVRLAAARRD